MHKHRFLLRAWLERGVHAAALLLCAALTGAVAHGAPGAAEPARACVTNPLGDTELFLRGSMNNWAARDDYLFRYDCDAFYLNVRLATRHEFKIADESWSQATQLGAPTRTATPEPSGALAVGKANDAGGVGNLSFVFSGEQTLRLAFNGPDLRPVLAIGPKSYQPPPPPVVTDATALSLRFDSRQLRHKAPFGAVKAGTQVQFTVNALPGVQRLMLVVEKRKLEGDQEQLEYTPQASLSMRRLVGADRAHQRWQASYRFDQASVYGYYFEALIAGKTYVLHNNKDVVYWTREVGANGVGLVDHKPATTKRIRRFRQTVFRPDFVVPSWARDVVYYYIFPERFRNGDQRNDPKPGVDSYQDHTVEFHKNWLDKPYRPGSGDGSDAVYNNDFFGGDIAGIIDKLDYIAELGANTLYINPMFKASSNHKYDTADYKNIDPAFGSNADFTRLTQEAAKRGIRVIPDTSLNHVGSDSLYFDRYGKYHAQGAFEGGKVNPASPYADWFTFDTTQTEPGKQYKGWVGVEDLPELNKASSSYRQFAYGAPDSVTRLWLQRGAAGWRMDVAPWVPDDFWREWRQAVKQTKPDALTVAETWWDGSKFLLGDTFDSTMNYIFRSTVLDYAKGAKASAVYHNIEFMREAYPPQAFYAQMNLLSTHDVLRSLNYLGLDDGVGEALAKARLRMAVFFQMTFPGAPTVYYGDEVGVSGGEDPYNRATYPWPDLGGQPDNALLADFKRLIKLRHDHPVLRHGSLDAPLWLDDNLVVLLRRDGASWAVTATNNAGQARTVTVTLPAAAPAGAWVEALTGERVSASGSRLTLTVPAHFGTVLVTGR
jgi:glycosidase